MYIRCANKFLIPFFPPDKNCQNYIARSVYFAYSLESFYHGENFSTTGTSDQIPNRNSFPLTANPTCIVVLR